MGLELVSVFRDLVETVVVVTKEAITECLREEVSVLLGNETCPKECDMGLMFSENVT